MRFEFRGVLPVVVVGLSLVGCASSGSTSAESSASRDIAEMKERILELQEQAAMTEVELDRLQTEVSNLRQQLAGGNAGRAAAAVEAPAARLLEIEEPMGVSNTTVIDVESADLETEAVAVVEMVPATATAPMPSTPAAGDPEPAIGGALQPVDPAAQALYDRGYTLYHQGKYLDAEASFQRFLQANPNTELSDNAQFWIGEARFARNDLQGALAAFREVVQKYPQGNKVPDSLIKEGDCLTMLGDTDGARDRFEEVRRRFPDTGAAVVAKDRLEKLDG